MAEDGEQKKGFVFLGKDISKIPCFRTSLLTGIGGGVIAGLGYFMFTSRVKRAADVAILSYVTVTAGRWVHCRHQFEQAKEKEKIFKKAIQERLLVEGTDLDQFQGESKSI